MPDTQPSQFASCCNSQSRVWLFLLQSLSFSTYTLPGYGCSVPQIDPEAMDDGSGELGNEKLWHQQALVTGAQHTPLGAAAGGGAAGGNVDDATVKVGSLVLLCSETQASEIPGVKRSDS